MNTIYLVVKFRGNLTNFWLFDHIMYVIIEIAIVVNKGCVNFVRKRLMFLARNLIFLIPALVAVLLYRILPYASSFTETVFSRFLFRVIGVPLGALTALFPISITEVLAVGALPLAIFLLVLLIRRVIRSSHRLRVLARTGKAVGWVLSSSLLLYMLMHGLNYDRTPLSELMGIDTSIQTPEILQKVCVDLAQKASAERSLLKEDENGVMMLSESIDTTLREADDGYNTLDNTLPFLWGGVWRAKPVQLSHWWSYTGITGMYFPFLVEANVNIDIADSNIPSTAAHEISHTRGFALEDDANFLAYLTSIHNNSADYRYSGYLLAYVYCSNALYTYNKGMWSAARANCSDGMLRDLAAQNSYWKQFEGEVQKISNTINDHFIQANGDKDGVFSYDRVVQLIVGYYCANDMV